MVKISQLLTGINQETENIGEKMKTLSRKSIGSLSAILLAGVLAVGQGSLFMASAAETGSVDSAVCTSTSSYSINLTGNFPGLVTDVGVNYLNNVSRVQIATLINRLLTTSIHNDWPARPHPSRMKQIRTHK